MCNYKKALAVLLFSVGSAMAMVDIAAAQNAATEEALNVDSSVGTLLDNPKSKEVLDTLTPGLSTDPRIDMAREMTLREIVPLSDGKLTPELLNTINDRLAQIK